MSKKEKLQVKVAELEAQLEIAKLEQRIRGLKEQIREAKSGKSSGGIFDINELFKKHPPVQWPRLPIQPSYPWEPVIYAEVA